MIMDNYYANQYTPNMYYQPTVTTPVYQYKWQQQPYTTTVPAYGGQQQNNGNILWVQGLEGVKAQNVPAGCNMAFFDSENQCVYIKSVDSVGKPSLTILDYVERGAKEENKDAAPQQIEYATREQLDNLTTQFTEINDKLNSLGGFVTMDQFDTLSSHMNDIGNHLGELGGQIEDIENRIMSFGKPQQNNQNRRNNKQ